MTIDVALQVNWVFLLLTMHMQFVIVDCII